MYLLGDGAADAALDLLSPSNARVVVGCAGLAGTLSLATSTTGLTFPVQLPYPYQLFLLARGSEASVKEPFGVFDVGFLLSFDVVEGRKECEEDCDEGTSIGVGIVGAMTGSSRVLGEGEDSTPGLLEDSG